MNHRRSLGRRDGAPCCTAGRSGSQAIPSLWHVTSPGVSEPLPEVQGSRQSPGSRALSDVGLGLGPLPSTGVKRLRRNDEPVRHPGRPVPHGRPVGSHALPPMGFPVLQVSPMYRHAVANTPVGSPDQIARGAASSSRSLVRRRRRPSPIYRRVGSHLKPFGACSTFTRVTDLRTR